ncbi:MAG: flagellar basal body rod protein FlgB [Clostridium sp.]|jgi:flagellar basal-body rod protein FlgB|nr:flagellar basal body rod protein FlgB [Clostridium sp.]
MFHSSAFDYIDILDKAADAGWLRNQALANNIANATTPGYKREDVAFEAQLQKALGSRKNEPMDTKVKNLDPDSLKPLPYTDYEGYSYRLDGNNVDPDNEYVMLAENSIKYQGLIDGLTKEFENLQRVMK